MNDFILLKPNLPSISSFLPSLNKQITPLKKIFTGQNKSEMKSIRSMSQQQQQQQKEKFLKKLDIQMPKFETIENEYWNEYNIELKRKNSSRLHHNPKSFHKSTLLKCAETPIRRELKIKSPVQEQFKLIRSKTIDINSPKENTNLLVIPYSLSKFKRRCEIKNGDYEELSDNSYLHAKGITSKVFRNPYSSTFLDISSSKLKSLSPIQQSQKILELLNQDCQINKVNDTRLFDKSPKNHHSESSVQRNQKKSTISPQNNMTENIVDTEDENYNFTSNKKKQMITNKLKVLDIIEKGYSKERKLSNQKSPKQFTCRNPQEQENHKDKDLINNQFTNDCFQLDNKNKTQVIFSNFSVCGSKFKDQGSIQANRSHLKSQFQTHDKTINCNLNVEKQKAKYDQKQICLPLIDGVNISRKASFDENLLLQPKNSMTKSNTKIFYQTDQIGLLKPKRFLSLEKESTTENFITQGKFHLKETQIDIDFKGLFDNSSNTMNIPFFKNKNKKGEANQGINAQKKFLKFLQLNNLDYFNLRRRRKKQNVNEKERNFFEFEEF